VVRRKARVYYQGEPVAMDVDGLPDLDAVLISYESPHGDDRHGRRSGRSVLGGTRVIVSARFRGTG
jgi:hypothetical protein